MATKKETEETPEVEETEEVEETPEVDAEEEANWERMRKMMGETFDERIKEWQSSQPAKKTTSSRSPRKAAAPKRKKGFLTGGFFSGLTDEEE